MRDGRAALTARTPATWFIDTDDDGNLFRVRHAYFLAGDDPYEKLRRALRADIDEDAWSTLYSATSRPFPRPRTGTSPSR